jgi:phage antirepressor YoqD-like protein
VFKEQQESKMAGSGWLSWREVVDHQIQEECFKKNYYLCKEENGLFTVEKSCRHNCNQVIKVNVTTDKGSEYASGIISYTKYDFI